MLLLGESASVHLTRGPPIACDVGPVESLPGRVPSILLREVVDLLLCRRVPVVLQGHLGELTEVLRRLCDRCVVWIVRSIAVVLERHLGILSDALGRARHVQSLLKWTGLSQVRLAVIVLKSHLSVFTDSLWRGITSLGSVCESRLVLNP